MLSTLIINVTKFVTKETVKTAVGVCAAVATGAHEAIKDEGKPLQKLYEKMKEKEKGAQDESDK